MRIASLLFITVAGMGVCPSGQADDLTDLDSAYYHTGELAGSLKTFDPLPLYDSNRQSLANRLFTVFYIRESNLPTKRDGQPVQRIEGGDVVDFYAWPGSVYWSTPETTSRILQILDECLAHPEQLRPSDPLKRAVLLRDLWGVFDFYISRNIVRDGSLEVRRQRDQICGKLAQVIQGLTLSSTEISELPDTYAAAVRSGHFAQEHNFDSKIEYLPPRLLTHPEEWQEIDFYQSPYVHDTPPSAYTTMHTRLFLGRSYFRVFYRFPGGRKELENFLPQVDAEGVDWKLAAQSGFIGLTENTPQIPVGTEVALVQFMMTLDDQLRPTPTPIVETVRLRVYANVDGGTEPPTNTDVGMNVSEFTLKRRLLFDGLKQGGLEREPDVQPLYRVIFMGEKAPDWGDIGRTLTLAQDCRRCHTGAGQIGVQSMFSLFNQGGLNTEAQMGISHPLPAGAPSPRGPRAVQWKTEHETYRRLLEYQDK